MSPAANQTSPRNSGYGHEEERAQLERRQDQARGLTALAYSGCCKSCTRPTRIIKPACTPVSVWATMCSNRTRSSSTVAVARCAQESGHFGYQSQKSYRRLQKSHRPSGSSGRTDVVLLRTGSGFQQRCPERWRSTKQNATFSVAFWGTEEISFPDSLQH